MSLGLPKLPHIDPQKIFPSPGLWIRIHAVNPILSQETGGANVTYILYMPPCQFTKEDENPKFMQH